MVEMIGFIISLLALFYLFMKQNVPNKQKRHSRKHSHPVDQEEEPVNDSFQEFLKTMQKEAVAREEFQQMPPPASKKKEHPKKNPPRLPENNRLVSSLEERSLKNPLENRHAKSRFSHHEDLPGRTLSLSLNHYDEKDEKRKSSRLQSTLRHLVQRQDMIIYQEIIGKPKSLRLEDPPP